MEISLKTDQFDGILSYLYHKNPNKFEVDNEGFGEKYTSGWSNPIEVFKPNIGTHFASAVDSAYITLHLKKNMLLITNYSFVTSKGHSHPISWNFFGIDNENEYLIDERYDTELCSGTQCRESNITTFDVKKYGVFKTFVFQQTKGSSASGNNFILLRSMEFYGSVIKIQQSNLKYFKGIV